MVDPGFPIGDGGAKPLGGVLTSDEGAFWQKHVKMKELDPIWGGGMCWQCPMDLPMLLHQNWTGVVILINHCISWLSHPLTDPLESNCYFTFVRLSKIYFVEKYKLSI